MVSGTGLREADTPPESAAATRFYRQSLGPAWLIGLLIIPLSIALIGYGATERARSAAASNGQLPTSAPATTGGPKLLLAPLSIVRQGNDITLRGDFPNESAKATLMKTLTGSLPPGMNVIDQLRVNPNVVALAFFNSVPVFKDSASIPDFTLTVNADTITLTGTAASPDQKDALDSDARRTWSNLDVVDQVSVNSGPSASAPPAAPAVQCTDLQAALNAVTGGPITFGTDGFSLTPEDGQMLTQVADKLKGCPSAHATLNGYTDNSGTEAMGIALSTQRAQTVADFLTAHGVPGNQLVVKGLGSVNPIAPNDTADGRAKNRRVELAVS